MHCIVSTVKCYYILNSCFVKIFIVCCSGLLLICFIGWLVGWLYMSYVSSLHFHIYYSEISKSEWNETIQLTAVNVNTATRNAQSNRIFNWFTNFSNVNCLLFYQFPKYLLSICSVCVCVRYFFLFFLFFIFSVCLYLRAISTVTMLLFTNYHFNDKRLRNYIHHINDYFRLIFFLSLNFRFVSSLYCLCVRFRCRIVFNFNDEFRLDSLMNSDDFVCNIFRIRIFSHLR